MSNSITNIPHAAEPTTPATREEIAVLLTELHAAATTATELDMTRASLLFALRQIERIEAYVAAMRRREQEA